VALVQFGGDQKGPLERNRIVIIRIIRTGTFIRHKDRQYKKINVKTETERIKTRLKKHIIVIIIFNLKSIIIIIIIIIIISIYYYYLNDLVVLSEDRRRYSSTVTLNDDVINRRPGSFLANTKSKRQIKAVAQPLIMQVPACPDRKCTPSTIS